LTNTPKWIIPRRIAILEGAAWGCDFERKVSWAEKLKAKPTSIGRIVGSKEQN
jgi:hypothetical protein